MQELPALGANDKKWLLALARRTLENLEPTGSRVPNEALLLEGEIPPRAIELQGAFVSLHKGGNLRGCIGYVAAHTALYRAVIENAVNAARRDPRFDPVRPDEVSALEIEISAMQPPHRIDEVDAIEVGRDGLIVSRGGCRGLLLPQVPAAQGWDRTTFLEHTCRKAGLPRDAWREPDTTIETFSAEVFSESDCSMQERGL